MGLGFSAQAQFSPVENAISLLEDFGFFQVILPILLIFALFYGILLRTQLFGKPGEQEWVKPVSAIVSFVSAFFVVTATDVVENLNTLIPQSAFLIVVGVLLLMMLVMFGAYDPGEALQSKWAKGIVAAIIIFVFLGVVDVAFGISIPIVHQLVLIFIGVTPAGTAASSDALTTFISILLILGIPAALIWWMTKSS